MTPLEITMFNQLFIGPKSMTAGQVVVPREDLCILSMEDEITQ